MGQCRRLSNADLRVRGCNITFHFGDIGSAGKQLGRKARGNDRRQPAKWTTRKREVRRSLSFEHCNRVFQLRALDVQCLSLCFRLVQQRLGLFDFQFARQSSAKTVRVQIHCSLQLLHCCVQNLPFGIVLAQAVIIHRHVGFHCKAYKS